MMAEGVQETNNIGFDEWLAKWNLSDIKSQLQNNGFSKPHDFKIIESKVQFEELASALNINLMQKFKLMKAWKSFVPNPEEPDAKIHFLGDEEKKILNTLNQRFSSLSKDIQHVKQSFNEFNESAVLAKQSINTQADKMVSIINKKREQLLDEIASIINRNQKLFKKKISALEKLNETRLKQLQQLLVIQTDSNDDDDDDEKKHEDVGAQCVLPEKISFIFDEDTFIQNVNSNIKVECDNKTTEWNLNPQSLLANTDCFANNNSLVFNYINKQFGYSYHVFGTKKINRQQTHQYEWIIEASPTFMGRLGIIDDTNDASNTLKNGTTIYQNKNVAIVGSLNGGPYSGTLFGSSPNDLIGFIADGDTITIRVDYKENKITFVSKIKNTQVTKDLKPTIRCVRFIADLCSSDSTLTLKTSA